MGNYAIARLTTEELHSHSNGKLMRREFLFNGNLYYCCKAGSSEMKLFLIDSEGTTNKYLCRTAGMTVVCLSFPANAEAQRRCERVGLTTNGRKLNPAATTDKLLSKWKADLLKWKSTETAKVPVAGMNYARYGRLRHSNKTRSTRYHGVAPAAIGTPHRLIYQHTNRQHRGRNSPNCKPANTTWMEHYMDGWLTENSSTALLAIMHTANYRRCIT
eukprot:jgi/Psemu1/15972/gm1.15972_g